MTRAEETARVAELRAAFAASDEPDPFRWFARRELTLRDLVQVATDETECEGVAGVFDFPQGAV
jgi:hypothetical protein